MASVDAGLGATGENDWDELQVDEQEMEEEPAQEVKKNKGGRPPKKGRQPRKKYETLPFRVRSADGTSWVDVTGLDEDVQTEMEIHAHQMAKGAKYLSSFVRMMNRFLTNGHEEHNCLACNVIRHRPSGECSIKKGDLNEACALCAPKFDGHSLHRKEPTLCAKVLRDQSGNVFAGYMPVPLDRRQGKQWNEMGYWRV
jgi:hypothetical protein